MLLSIFAVLSIKTTQEKKTEMLTSLKVKNVELLVKLIILFLNMFLFIALKIIYDMRYSRLSRGGFVLFIGKE